MAEVELRAAATATTAWSAQTLTALDTTDYYWYRKDGISPKYVEVALSYGSLPTAVNIAIEVSQGGVLWHVVAQSTDVRGETLTFAAPPGFFRLKIQSFTGTFTTTATVALTNTLDLYNAEVGTLLLTDPTALTQDGFLVIGENPDNTGMEVGGNTGRVDGISINLTNAAATLSGFFTGVNAEITNAGVGTEYMCAGQFNAFKTSGISTSGFHMAGIRARTQLTAGTCPGNMFSVNSKLIIYPSAVASVDGVHETVLSAGYFTSDIAGTADIGTYTATSAIHAELIGNNSTGAGAKHKHTGIIIASLGGDSSQVTCGAFFKARCQNSIGASQADYGLDLYDDLAGAYKANTFATADIRLGGSVGPVIMQYTANPNGVLTRPKGSLCIDTTNATLYQNDDGSTTWSLTSA
jgi:hypothetical protein